MALRWSGEQSDYTGRSALPNLILCVLFADRPRAIGVHAVAPCPRRFPDSRSLMFDRWRDEWWSNLALGGIVLAISAILMAAAIRGSGDSLAKFMLRRIIWLYCKLWHGWRAIGLARLPTAGPAIIISNHTSTVDPFFLQCATHRVISFLMAREYLGIRWMQPIYKLSGVIAVNRTGRDTAATRAALRALEEGRVLGIFPEGGIRLERHGVGAGKPGAAMLALRARAPIYPAYIDRRLHSNSIVRAVLDPCKTRVYFGPPLDLSAYYAREQDRELLREVAEFMMQSIAALAPSR